MTDQKTLYEVRKIVDATWNEAASLFVLGSEEQARHRVAQGMNQINNLQAEAGYPEQK